MGSAAAGTPPAFPVSISCSPPRTSSAPHVFHYTDDRAMLDCAYVRAPTSDRCQITEVKPSSPLKNDWSRCNSSGGSVDKHL